MCRLLWVSKSTRDREYRADWEVRALELIEPILWILMKFDSLKNFTIIQWALTCIIHATHFQWVCVYLLFSASILSLILDCPIKFCIVWRFLLQIVHNIVVCKLSYGMPNIMRPYYFAILIKIAHSKFRWNYLLDIHIRNENKNIHTHHMGRPTKFTYHRFVHWHFFFRLSFLILFDYSF